MTLYSVYILTLLALILPGDIWGAGTYASRYPQHVDESQSSSAAQSGSKVTSRHRYVFVLPTDLRVDHLIIVFI